MSKFNNTTNAVDPSLRSTAADPVRSERYHYFDAGVNQDITPNLHVGVDAYYKIKKYVLDEGQFGPAMIFSPNNAAKGLVRGVEVTVSYEKDGFAAWGNVARSQATAKGIVSGQWQFSPGRSRLYATATGIISITTRIGLPRPEDPISGAIPRFIPMRFTEADSIAASAMRPNFRAM